MRIKKLKEKVISLKSELEICKQNNGELTKNGEEIQKNFRKYENLYKQKLKKIQVHKNTKRLSNRQIRNGHIRLHWHNFQVPISKYEPYQFHAKKVVPYQKLTHKEQKEVLRYLNKFNSRTEKKVMLRKIKDKFGEEIFYALREKPLNTDINKYLNTKNFLIAFPLDKYEQEIVKDTLHYKEYKEMIWDIVVSIKGFQNEEYLNPVEMEEVKVAHSIYESELEFDSFKIDMQDPGFAMNYWYEEERNELDSKISTETNISKERFTTKENINELKHLKENFIQNKNLNNDCKKDKAVEMEMEL